MQATCTNKKTFQLSNKEQLLGELIYKSLFSFSAEIVMHKTEIYLIKPVGIFSNCINVFKNDIVIATLKMNWHGQVVIHFKDGQEYLLKAMGLLQSKYIVENKNGEPFILLDPQFNWSKFNYNYTISYEKQPQDVFFVLLCIYATNYLIFSTTSSIAGAV